MVDFNPDFSDDFEVTENASIQPVKEEKAVKPIVVNPPSREIMSMNNLLSLTQSHIEDDARCREELVELGNLLDANAHLMSIKDIIELMKIKIREREFHVDVIFKAFNLVQKSELAREIFIGSDRKERIIEATDRTRINKLLGMLNENAVDEARED